MKYVTILLSWFLVSAILLAAFQEDRNEDKEPVFLRFRLEENPLPLFPGSQTGEVGTRLINLKSDYKQLAWPERMERFFPNPNIETAEQGTDQMPDFARDSLARLHMESAIADFALIAEIIGQDDGWKRAFISERFDLGERVYLEMAVLYHEIPYLYDSKEYVLPRARLNVEISDRLKAAVSAGRYLQYQTPDEDDVVFSMMPFLEPVDITTLELEYKFTDTFSSKLEIGVESSGINLTTSFKKRF